MIKRVGFFREFTPQETNTSAPSVHEAARPHALHDESGLLAYLASGTEIFSAMGAERDVITGDEWIPGAGSLVTDGTWLWPMELHHYVERYHVQLSADFMATVRAGHYIAAAVSRGRTEEIIQEVFGNSSFAARPNGTAGTDGYFSWYIANPTPQSYGRMLNILETVGMKVHHPLTGDVSLTRVGDQNRAAQPVPNALDLADALTDPGGGEVALHLWFASDTYSVMRVRGLNNATAVVVHDLAGLQEPEREQVVATLVQALDQLRGQCRGFVLDRSAHSPREAWDAVVCEGASPSAPLPDSIAINASRFAPPTEFDSMARATYGHLTVFNKRPSRLP